MSTLAHRSPTTDSPERQDTAATRGGGLGGMLWLTWRQHRVALLGLLAFAVVVVGWMTFLSVDLTSIHHQCHNTACSPYSPQEATLKAPFGLFRQVEILGLVLQYAPLLIGIFIGVPLLAREHEQRTLLLAWSQDISPMRWLWTKLGLLVVYVAALSVVASAVSDHLAHVFAVVDGGGLFDFASLMVTGMLPLASSICWFAVGVALGAVIRRTLPAVFGLIAGFLGVTLGLQWRYPTLMKPLSVYRPIGAPEDHVFADNALRVRGGIVRTGGTEATGLFDPSGHQVTGAELERLCPSGADVDREFACFAGNHLTNYVEYQPGSRIPEFHLILGAGYLGLAAVALVTVWLIVRRTNLSAG